MAASGRENKWFVWRATEVNQALTRCNASHCIPEVLKIQILMRKHGTARLIFAYRKILAGRDHLRKLTSKKKRKVGSFPGRSFWAHDSPRQRRLWGRSSREKKDRGEKLSSNAYVE